MSYKEARAAGKPHPGRDERGKKIRHKPRNQPSSSDKPQGKSKSNGKTPDENPNASKKKLGAFARRRARKRNSDTSTKFGGEISRPGGEEVKVLQASLKRGQLASKKKKRNNKGKKGRAPLSKSQKRAKAARTDQKKEKKALAKISRKSQKKQ